jgi:hypothetical protein
MQPGIAGADCPEAGRKYLIKKHNAVDLVA